MSKDQHVLSPVLRAGLENLGRQLKERDLDPATLQPVLMELANLSPRIAAQAEREMVELAMLYPRPQGYWKGLLPFRVEWVPREDHSWDLDALRRLDGLEQLLIFHRDGHLREAALEKLQGALSGPFMVVGVASRLNDWVPEVREAARRCAERVFPETSTEILAAAAIVLMDRRESWRRWRREREALDGMLARQDVLDRLATVIAASSHGHTCAILRLAIREPGMDRHLMGLFHLAAQPSVRALALSWLIEGRARWIVGRRKRWIDQRYTLWKWVPEFAGREVERPWPIEALIEAGGRDRSVRVRKVAAEGLVLHRATVVGMDDLLQAFLQDRNPWVRDCAEFVLRERGKQPGSTPSPR
jgi:hypothetical protein